MFESFKARSVERDQALDEKRISKMMGCIQEIQNDCMDELAGLSARIENYRQNVPGPDKRPSAYFDRPNQIAGASLVSMTAAEKRIEVLNGYINTCVNLRTQFMVDVKTNQSAIDKLMEHSSAARDK